jgi:hypothetical protein
MAGEGHLERFPPPKPSVGCRFCKPTLAGTLSKQEVAPISVVAGISAKA